MQDLGRNMYFMSIDEAKFRKAARPGDMFEYHVDKLAQPQHVVVRGEAKVGDVLIAGVELSAYLVKE
jgi:3-hydroxyacyl-[acyl-carrier-protein] dehydratase